MDCPNCGNECSENEVFCKYCGYRLKDTTQPTDSGIAERKETFGKDSERSLKRKKRTRLIVILVLIVSAFAIAYSILFGGTVFSLIDSNRTGILKFRIRVSPGFLDQTTEYSRIVYGSNYNGFNIVDDKFNVLQYVIAENCGSEMLELLIKEGADVNYVSPKSETPLTLAVEKKNEKYARILLSNGAYVNHKNAEGETPLKIASDNRYTDMMKLLLEFKADPEIMHDAKYGEEEIELPLLMYEAILGNGAPMVEALIAAGADVNKEDFTGATTLERCLLQNPDLELIRILVENGADLEHLYKGGLSPLMIAINEKCDLSIIKYLIEAGSDLQQFDSNGRTPLMLAIAEDCDFEIIKSLIDSNPESIDIENNGLNVIQQAIIGNSSLEIIRYIVGNFADLHCETKYGNTLSDLAEYYASEEIQEYIDLATKADDFMKMHLIDKASAFSLKEKREIAEKYVLFYEDFDMDLVFITGDSSIQSIDLEAFTSKVLEETGVNSNRKYVLTLTPSYVFITWNSYSLGISEDEATEIMNSVTDYSYFSIADCAYELERAARRLMEKKKAESSDSE